MKIIFLLGWFCLNGECVSINQKHTSLHDCKKQGTELHLLMKEYDIRKYRFVCVDGSQPTY